MIRMIGLNPYIGRPTDRDGAREAGGVYHIFHRPNADTLYIVRSIDGRRDLSKVKF